MAPQGTVELCSIETEDGRRLDGVHYQTHIAEGPDAVVVHVHGKGENFYTGPGRFLPPRLAANGIDSLSINMRFHDLAYTRADYEGGDTLSFGADGGMWESIADGKKDLRACVAWLHDSGYRNIFLSGHSAGGYYVGEYSAHGQNVAGRILLSPLQDHRFILPLWFPDEKVYHATLSGARQLVAEGRGHHLIPVPGWYYAISAQSLIERDAQPDGVWFDAIESSDTPLLMLWGDVESRDSLWAGLFDSFSVPSKVKVVLPGSDHFYVGYEDDVGAAVSRFVHGVLLQSDQ